MTVAQRHVAECTVPPEGQRQQEGPRLSAALLSGTSNPRGRFNQPADPGKDVEKYRYRTKQGKKGVFQKLYLSLNTIRAASGADPPSDRSLATTVFKDD